MGAAQSPGIPDRSVCHLVSPLRRNRILPLAETSDRGAEVHLAQALAQPAPTMPADAVSPPNFTGLATRVARASAVYGLANFGIRALNFLLLPVFTRYLSPLDYGTMAMAETVAMHPAVGFRTRH